jgi:endoglucanase
MSILKTFARSGGAALAGVIAVLLCTLDTGSAPAQSGNPQSAAAVADGTPKLGVYDPAGVFGGASSLSIEHIYLPLIGVDLESLREAGSYAATRGRDLLVTVEPWSWDGRWNLANEEAIAEIVAGKLDEEIVSLCRTIGHLPSPVIVRWGHEMEARTTRYAWTMLPPEDYIAGYRHFVSLCREHAPSAQFMWSPMGEPGLVSFYPGDDAVDVIGFSVFA